MLHQLYKQLLECVCRLLNVMMKVPYILSQGGSYYIANLKPRWIDFDAGQLMNESMDDLAAKFIQYMIDVASGKKTNNEKYDVHGIVIFKTGVTE